MRFELACLALVTTTGCSTVPGKTAVPKMTTTTRVPPSPEARTLEKKLLGFVESGRMALGHQDALSYGVGHRGGDSDVRRICGKDPKVLGFDLGHLELGADSGGRNLDGVPFEDMQNNIRLGHARGLLVTVSWHMRNLANGGDAWNTKAGAESILFGGEHHERLTAALDRASSFFDALRDEDGTPIPILFRPYHEHTGDWFWWGKGITSEQDYRELFRFTVDYLTRVRGQTQLLFAISPAASRSRSTPDYLYGYPGDEFVDVLGLDEYFDEDPSSFLDATRVAVVEAERRSKVAAITEFGPRAENYDRRPRWLLEDFWKPLRTDPTARRVAFALAWRNDRPAHAFLPYPGHESASALAELCRSPELVLGDE